MTGDSMWSEQTRARLAARGPRRWATCLLGIAALAVSGCGSSGSSTAGSTQQLTASAPSSGPTAQLIVQADAICKRRNAALSALPLKSPNAHEVELFAAKSVALDEAALAELSRLSAPASLASDWQQILGYTSGLRGDMVKLREDAKHNDTKPIVALGQSTASLKKKLLAVATRAGFKDCARP
jgi:hypothetical protein